MVKNLIVTKRSILFHINSTDHENFKIIANRQRTSMSTILRIMTSKYIQTHLHKPKINKELKK